jgi:homoserine O-succinyltransferase
MPLEVELHPIGDPPHKRADSASPIVVGLINNMPDSALEATEAQFTTLLAAASSTHSVQLRCASLPTVPRKKEAQAIISARYWPLGDLLDSNPDALIVTGTEPKRPALEDEPYWQQLALVIDHAAQRTVSTVFSCLAAHAAVLHLDGIQRQRLSAKRFGVFPQTVPSGHALMRGIGAVLHTPHSRWNDVPSDMLLRRGYAILSGSSDSGVDAFFRQEESLLVMLQGHPEYESRTLLKEYQRDVSRFVSGEYPEYPRLPANYFDTPSCELLNQFERDLKARAFDDPLAAFPFKRLAGSIGNTWSAQAIQLYGNWLDFIAERKAR